MKPHLPVRLLSFLESSIGISLTVAAQDATIAYMMSDSAAVSADTGATASIHMLYIMVPEPATASLGLLALAALATRRKRRS
ncbi:MAG: PEP-CTERM sorting domain-containing protein [Akkermansia sp.]|nr:PEP-CTERM sorting domain-containing protein [Akkermansia sp.]